MFFSKAIISDNLEVVPGHYRLTLEIPKIPVDTYPGQFMHIKICEQYDPLLRRPFSIHRIDRETGRIEILYKVVGKGTRLLKKAQVGDRLDILGPLGKGFRIDKDLKTAILIAGGIGVSPLLFLGDELRKMDVSTYVFIGAKTRSLILCEDAFKELGCEVKVSTEDGSLGYCGNVTDLLHKSLLFSEYTSLSFTSLFACGPYAMLHKVAGFAKTFDIECQVSLEERLACGVGACLGCVVRFNGYKRVCKDGPVFSTREGSPEE